MNKLDILAYVVIGIVLGICIYIYLSKLEGFDLKCIISTVDGNEYCVREREKVDAAANLLARVTDKCKQLVKYAGEKYEFFNKCSFFSLWTAFIFSISRRVLHRLGHSKHKRKRLYRGIRYRIYRSKYSIDKI